MVCVLGMCQPAAELIVIASARHLLQVFGDVSSKYLIVCTCYTVCSITNVFSLLCRRNVDIIGQFHTSQFAYCPLCMQRYKGGVYDCPRYMAVDLLFTL